MNLFSAKIIRFFFFAFYLKDSSTKTMLHRKLKASIIGKQHNPVYIASYPITEKRKPKKRLIKWPMSICQMNVHGRNRSQKAENLSVLTTMRELSWEMIVLGPEVHLVYNKGQNQIQLGIDFRRFRIILSDLFIYFRIEISQLLFVFF